MNEPLAMIEKAGQQYRLIEFDLMPLEGQDTPVRSVRCITEYHQLEDLLCELNEGTLSPEALGWYDITEAEVPKPWVDYYRAWVKARHDQGQASIRTSIDEGLWEIGRLSSRVRELMAMLDRG